MGFDTVIRNATVATAADVFTADIAISGGVITALGRSLGPARRDIDAAGRYVLPGGIDTHCHLDQPMRGGVTLADDFLSGSVSAAHGGTTTVVPFACQLQGQRVRAAVEDYHRRAKDKPVIDYAFHLIISDPTEPVLRDELPALIGEGYTSFKIYMTYETLRLNDRQIIAVLAVARREGAMVMVHAENADCITWLTEELEKAGRTAPYYHAVSRPLAVEREGTHRAITMAEIVDVPILLGVTRRARRRSGPGSRRASSPRSRRTTRRSASTTRRARSVTVTGRRSPGCPTGCRGSRHGCRSSFPRASTRDGSISRRSSRSRRPIRRSSMVSIRARGRSPWA